jgi:carnitine O-palmitoyltransferase 2
MKFQDSLLRLPLPKLEDTCKKYLECLEPVVTKEQFKEAKGIVKDFEKNEGKKLQEILQTRNNQNKNTSFISKPWYDMYLEARDPLPVNSNPFLLLTEDAKKKSQITRSASLLRSSIRFYESLKENVLSPDIYLMKGSKYEEYKNFFKFIPNMIALYPAVLLKAYPLDMSQYSMLFGTTRIPKNGKDFLQRGFGSHCIVLHKNNFYKLPLFEENGSASSEQQIASRLLSITQDNSPAPKGLFY